MFIVIYSLVTTNNSTNIFTQNHRIILGEKIALRQPSGLEHILTMIKRVRT